MKNKHMIFITIAIIKNTTNYGPFLFFITAPHIDFTIKRLNPINVIHNYMPRS